MTDDRSSSRFSRFLRSSPYWWWWCWSERGEGDDRSSSRTGWLDPLCVRFFLRFSSGRPPPLSPLYSVSVSVSLSLTHTHTHTHLHLEDDRSSMSSSFPVVLEDPIIQSSSSSSQGGPVVLEDPIIQSSSSSRGQPVIRHPRRQRRPLFRWK